MPSPRSHQPALLLGLLTATAGLRGQATLPPADPLFGGALPRIELRITPEGIAKLQKEPREYVPLTLQESGSPALERCSVKLKGSAGSFRQINEERPGFSIRTNKKNKNQAFRGLVKFQLNNGAQDGTLLHELIAGEMARRCAVPASRCAHAYVTLNGKVLGTYVLKEGFNTAFLGAFFKDTSGHLYDGGFCNELNPGLEVDQGDPDEKARLTELLGAIKEPNPALRLQRLERITDLDAYLRHVALESVLCHWDGYSFNHNNYRLYEEPTLGKFYFILHGMDQVFGDNRWYVFRAPASDLPRVLWESKAVRERYRAQFFNVYEKGLRPVDWPKHALELAAAAKAKLQPVDAAEAARFDQRGQEAANQIRDRMENIRRQVEDAYQLRTIGGSAQVGSFRYAWNWSTDKGDCAEEAHEGRDCLRIRIGAEKGGDYRLPLSLGAGRYRLTGQVKTADVRPGPDERTAGARARVSGVSGVPALTGTAAWRPYSFEFSVAETEPVLVLELRGAAGTAWFDRNSMLLTRIP